MVGSIAVSIVSHNQSHPRCRRWGQEVSFHFHQDCQCQCCQEQRQGKTRTILKQSPCRRPRKTQAGRQAARKLLKVLNTWWSSFLAVCSSSRLYLVWLSYFFTYFTIFQNKSYTQNPLSPWSSKISNEAAQTNLVKMILNWPESYKTICFLGWIVGWPSLGIINNGSTSFNHRLTRYYCSGKLKSVDTNHNDHFNFPNPHHN